MIDKSLANITKTEKILVNQLKNEREDVTTDTTETQWINRDYFKKLQHSIENDQSNDQNKRHHTDWE